MQACHCEERSDEAILMKAGFIYIMTNKNNTVLYTGVTSNLPKRIKEHKEKFHELSFTSKYNLNKLVYWEAFQEIGDAIFREKQLKLVLGRKN